MRTKGTITCKILATRFLEMTNSEKIRSDSVTQPSAENNRKQHFQWISAVQDFWEISLKSRFRPMCLSRTKSKDAIQNKFVLLFFSRYTENNIRVKKDSWKSIMEAECSWKLVQCCSRWKFKVLHRMVGSLMCVNGSANLRLGVNWAILYFCSTF